MQVSAARRVRSRAVFAAGVCALLMGVLAQAVPSSADASTPQQITTAKRWFAQAEAAEAAGRWQEAIELLEKVVAVKETAGVRFHIAICHAELGHLAQAYRGMLRARELAVEQGADDVLALVDPKIADLGARVPVLRVIVPVALSDVSATVDGQPVAASSLGEIFVDPGTHQVVVMVGGEARIDRYVDMQEGKIETLELARPQPQEPSPRPEKSAPSAPRRSDDARASTASVPVIAWVALGAGAALGVGGYLAYQKADSVASESARVCAQSLSCDQSRVDSVRKWDGTALALWIGSAAAFGTGVTLVLTSRPTAQSDVALVVSPSSLHVQGGF